MDPADTEAGETGCGPLGYEVDGTEDMDPTDREVGGIRDVEPTDTEGGL